MRYFKKENEEAERKIGEVVEQVKAEILHHLGNQVVSIVLFGSLARGEGAWKDKDGRLEIASDLEFLVITRRIWKIPQELESALRDIENKTGLDPYLEIKNYITLRFLLKNTFTFDIKESGTVIYGESVAPKFPKFKEGDINFEDIVSLFFTRIILTVRECSPHDFASLSQDVFQKLSRIAPKIMFTCTDLIAIYYGSYSPSIIERVKFAQDKLENTDIDVGIDTEQFLIDLSKALDFRFEQSNKLYLEDVHNYWLRARSYLVSLFLLFFERKYGTRDLLKYSHFLKHRNTSFRYAIRSILSRFRITYALLRLKKLPNFFGTLNPTLYCRLACLMLFLALGEEIQKEHLIKAQKYMSKVYFHKKSEIDTESMWLNLRDELETFRKSAIV